MLFSLDTTTSVICGQEVKARPRAGRLEGYLSCLAVSWTVATPSTILVASLIVRRGGFD